jgi:hypothetical protein
MPATLGNRRAKSQRYEPPGVKFAAVDGSPTNDGSIYSPWTLDYALLSLPAGYTLYLRGGTYDGAFTTALNGTQESHRRTIRSYPGEWAIIDSGIHLVTGSDPNGALEVEGDYWTIRDMELMNSDTNSRVLAPSVPYNSTRRGNGLWITGTNNQQINVLVHDNGNGITWWGDAGGGLSYGNVVWNNGWAGDSNVRGHGQGFYTQNDPASGTKRFENCISTNTGATTLRCEGAAGYADNVEIIDCTLEGAGAPSAMTSLFADTYRDTMLDLGSEDHAVNNITIDKVRMFELTGCNPQAIYLAGPGPYTGYTVKNSELRPGTCDGILFARNATGVDIHDNIVFGDGLFAGNENLAKIETSASGTWNNNAYYYKNGPFWYVNQTPGLKTFTEWKAATGFDAASTQAIDTYPPDAVYVVANAWETGRSHVTIYNQIARTNTVSVSLSGTGLVNGDTYYVFNAMNPLAGSVATGTYSGASIAFPMTNGTAGVPATPVGDLPRGPSTFPDFGVFVVRKYPTMQRGI